MPVSPPLDLIPRIPSQLVSIIIPLIDNVVLQLSEILLSAIEDAVKLPDRIDCNDPRVQLILDKMNQAQELLGRIQTLVGVINRVLPIIKTLIGVSMGIKSALLLNPITGPALIAQELKGAADLTIANAIEVLKSFQNYPERALGIALDSATDKLAEIAVNLAPICGEISVPTGVQSKLDDRELKQIDELTNLLQSAVDTNTGLLISLEEAPSKVYEGTNSPIASLGKPGDYFVDTTNKVIYGPKPIRTDWGDGVNY